MDEAREYYDILQDAVSAPELSVATYRQLRMLLERLCRTQMPDESLQMTDLSARISYLASKLNLSWAEQNRLHTFRLTSNDILNGRVRPCREHLLRDVQALAWLVQKTLHVEVPKTLCGLAENSVQSGGKQRTVFPRTARIRVCFQYADDNFLYVNPVDEIAPVLWRVRYNVPGVNDEFADTCRLLWPHARLNLLDVSTEEDGTLLPGFIILEPDYLIDISSLAECFKTYGHHPANYLMARLRMPANTAPLLLGNIANLFLDEWIYADGQPDYLACMKKVFRMYALELAACPDLTDAATERAFFANCWRHFEHIGQVVGQTFAEATYGLNRADAVLEPSYLCEALGLQGRLDYMQRDMNAFIEMKSGKADEYALRGKVEPHESHCVQMLLYMATLQYTMGINHQQVKAYLLYTHYPLLYPARPSWAMVRRVMNVRNLIVAQEYAVQLHNSPDYTAQVLASIAPDVLNQRQVSGALWVRYQAPAIASLQHQLQALSPLERKYFRTVYNFITKELYTSKSGDVDSIGCNGAASLWLSTMAEKCESGEILYDLVITENHSSEIHKPFLTLTWNPAEVDNLPNFRVGDAIVLYERNRPTDRVTNKLVFKGNVEHLGEGSITIRLRAAQRNQHVLPCDSRYAMEHDVMDTAFRTMFQGLAEFLAATQRRRDLLLGLRPPEYDETASTASVTDDFARVISKAQAARDYFLLVGPPGTGKTSRALRGMVETFYKEGKQILLLSYTNRAVDEICKALSAITPAIDYIRVGSELACEELYRPHLLENALAACRNREEVRHRLSACRVYVGTVATLSAKTDLFRLKSFDVAIIDEASQILEPQLLGLLCRRSFSGDDAIGKFILIGDHKQLPAVVMQASKDSEVCDDDLRALGLLNMSDALFERLYRTMFRHVPDAELATRLKTSPVCDMLCSQGRMNAEIAAFPSHAFYHDLLRPLGLAHQSGQLTLAPGMETDEFADLLVRRVSFLPSEPEAISQSVKINHSEARLAARLARSVYLQYASTVGFDAYRTLGIITPYRSQIALIWKELASLGISPLERILVDTVERFQGSERDVIIYSFCVNRAYQLKYLANLMEENGAWIDRKLNVALTRARLQMFILGVPHLLRLSPIYANLIDFCKL